MDHRVDIKSILADSKSRRDLLVDSIIAIQAVAGIDTSREQAEVACDAPTRAARQLVAEGYYSISRKYGRVARVDVPDVRLAMREKGHQSEGPGWSIVDHWLRCFSKDVKTLPFDEYRDYIHAGGGTASSKYLELNDLYGYGWPERGHVFVPMPDGSMKDITIEHMLSAIWTARPSDRKALRELLEADPRWREEA